MRRRRPHTLQFFRWISERYPLINQQLDSSPAPGFGAYCFLFVSLRIYFFLLFLFFLLLLLLFFFCLILSLSSIQYKAFFLDARYTRFSNTPLFLDYLFYLPFVIAAFFLVLLFCRCCL